MATVEISGIKVSKQKEITAEMMIQYIENNAPNDKKWFKDVSFAEMPDITFQPKKDEKGNIIYKKTKDKNGNEIYKLNKKGEKIEVKEAVQTGRSKKFNIVKARAEFCKKYFPQLVKVKRKESITDLLKSW